MSLDVYLMVTQPTSVYSDNITHKMAIDVGEGRTLYDILWRPDEYGYVYAREIVDCLHKGLKELYHSPDLYTQYNPENGWGSYEGLVEFVKQYHAACMEAPAAELRVSR